MRTTYPKLLEFVEKHHLTLREVAAGAGLTLSGAHAIVNGFQRPRVDNALRIVEFFRKFDRRVTVEKLWGGAQAEGQAAA